MNTIGSSLARKVVFGVAALAVMGFCATAQAGNTKGKGKFSSADGSLPTVVKGGCYYDVPITITANANQWPCSVTATLKSQNWANLGGSTTVLTQKGTIKATQTQITFNPTIYLSPVHAALAKSGSLWWEITVKLNGPAIKTPTDNFDTTKVKFTVKK